MEGQTGSSGETERERGKGKARGEGERGRKGLGGGQYLALEKRAQGVFDALSLHLIQTLFGLILEEGKALRLCRHS